LITSLEGAPGNYELEKKTCSNLPSGAHTCTYKKLGKITFLFYGEINQLFLWTFSIAMLVFSLPEGNFEGNYNYIIIVIATTNPTLGIT
jgi:hypothetical protein